MHEVAVIGAGSWGTALSMVLADNGCKVSLWSRDQSIVDELNNFHTNSKYLPMGKLPDTIICSTDIEKVVRGKRYILVVIPSHSLREIIRSIHNYLSPESIIIHATKGLEINSSKRISEVIHEELINIKYSGLAVLSGPSHAEEVVLRKPTTVVVASQNIKIAEEVQDLLMNNYFRVYTNPDVIGVEISGALKNIIALGVGISDGLGFGDNAKAALITRGLAEIKRLGIKIGADPQTFSGLAGIGDLVVTSTSVHSRNWRAGNMLGKGIKLDEVLDKMGMVVEGINTTKAAYNLSKYYDIEMPITNEIYAVLFADKDPRIAVEDLMGRVKKHEMEKIL